MLISCLTMLIIFCITNYSNIKALKQQAFIISLILFGVSLTKYISSELFQGHNNMLLFVCWCQAWTKGKPSCHPTCAIAERPWHLRGCWTEVSSFWLLSQTLPVLCQTDLSLGRAISWRLRKQMKKQWSEQEGHGCLFVTWLGMSF